MPNPRFTCVDKGNWRDIPWAPQCQVSDEGQLRQKINAKHPKRRQFRYLRIEVLETGHHRTQFAGKNWAVHRVVYAVFKGKLKSGLVICHRDGVPSHNAATNLVQATQAVNMSHKIRHGTRQHGERNGHALYTDACVAGVKADVSRAARCASSGRMKRGEPARIASLHNVHVHLVHDLARNKSRWASV